MPYAIVELIIQTIFTKIYGYALLFGINLAKKKIVARQ